ncbi:copper-binding protein [Collimonas silvisoli]|uniref:copper-binding protein n=1 Tax=Collimonas silvisoli TaxID=2825884 RepID=UPI0038B3F475
MAAEEMAKADAAAEIKPADAAAMSAGEVKKIDKEAGKITIKHGPLANLEMPPMTMVFRVKDPIMLDQVKPGDKINFVAEKANGALTVTQLQAGG